MKRCLGLVACGVAVGLVIGELALRIGFPQLTYSRMLLVTGEHWRTDDVVPFTLKASYRAETPSFEFPWRNVPVTTNADGLRGHLVARPKPAGVRRVLFLGDSFTYGVQVADGEEYPARVEKLAGVEAVNAGYADALSPDEHYAWLNARGFAYEPDVVAYGFFLGNDLEEIAEKNWRDRDADGLPRRLVSDDLWVDGVGRLTLRRDDWRTLSTEGIYHVPVLRESHVATLAYRAARWTALRFFPAPKRPHERNWDDFAWVVEPKSDEYMRTRERLFLRLVKGLRDRAREHGARFVMMLIPLNFQVEPRFLKWRCPRPDCAVRRNYFAELKPQLAAAGIPYVDLLDEMTKEPGRYFFRNGDVHFNARGHAFAAKKLAALIDGAAGGGRRTP